MTSNILKIIACISMVIDHVGYFLYPEYIILRYIGRLAMPIFSFFIAEGCRHTHSKIKYCLNLLFLGSFCQLIFVLEEFINQNLNSIYLNILFTFFLSAIIGCSFLNAKNSISRKKGFVNILFLVVFILIAIKLCLKTSILGIPFQIDYGIAGVILPLFAIIFSNKRKQLLLYTIGIIAYCLILCNETPYIWFSLFSIPLLLFYNGSKGKIKMKRFFYLFYPIHFALIYLIGLLI